MGLAAQIAAWFAAFPPWLGSVPAWITAGSVATYLGLWIRRELGLKNLEVRADEVRVEAKKVRNADEADIRDHWAEELKQLRDKLSTQERRFQEALSALDQRHNDALMALEERHGRAMLAAEKRQASCEEEREKLAVRFRDLFEEFTGVREQIRMSSSDQIRLLAASNEPIPPYALEAAQRIIEKHKGDKR